MSVAGRSCRTSGKSSGPERDVPGARAARRRRWSLRRLAPVALSLPLLATVAVAAPAGYIASSAPGAPGGTAALTFGPDGTLYLADMGQPGELRAVPPAGSPYSIGLSGATLSSVGGMAWDIVSGRILVTDNKGWADGQGYLYAVDTTSGAVDVLASGIDFIDDVAVSPVGHIFISDANWGPAGRVAWVPRSGPPQTVVSGLNLAAGVAFDPSGNIVFQDLDASFMGNVWRASVADGPGGPIVGPAQLLASGLSAAFDLAVDGEGDVFVTGFGGLFKLDRGPGGTFTGTASLFDNNGNPWQFATEIAFMRGADPFEPFGGADGGRLAYVPEYAARDLVSITTAVPLPATAAAGVAMVALVATGRRRNRV